MFTSYPKGIHALPVELLTRVFVLGAEDDHPYRLSPFLLKPDQNYYPVPSTLFQLTASHVCRHWRHVALTTPALWTTLCFREQPHIPRAAAYLQRCTRSPSRRFDILVDTVAPKDHVPGVTLCRDELTSIFDLICPHVPNWRAFHLKIRDDTCKQIARKYLGNAPPAPNLQTLQLYHFEDFRVAQDLYIATYRRPVSIFSNSLPNLRNVSLIGVNLPWDASPYLHSFHTLELALHSDHTRPPYMYWDRMLRLSPHLQRLLLHYSGPRAENGTEDLAWTAHDYSYLDSSDSSHSYSNSTYATETDPKRNAKGKAKQIDSDNEHDGRVLLESLWELSLTDLDPDYLCRVLQRLLMPSVNKLSLHLPDQDFTPFVQLIAPPPPLLQLHEHESMPLTAGTPCIQSHGRGTVSAQLPVSGLDPGDGVRHFASGSGSSWLPEDQSRNFPVMLASSSAQTPMFQAIESPSPPEIMTIPVRTSPTSSLSASLTSSIKSALSSISPSTMTTVSTSPTMSVLASGPSSSSTMSASRNMNVINTSSISVNSLASFGSRSSPSTSRSQTRSGSSPLHSAHSTHSTGLSHSHSASSSSTSSLASSSTSVVPMATAMNNNPFIANQRHWPLPRLSATLHTLIITALDCEFSAWRMFLATLEGVRDLEVSFHKVRFTGMQRKKCGDGNGDLACRVLLDRVGVGCMAGQTMRTRMVLPLLKSCKAAGLSGLCVRRLVEGRERGSGVEQRVEWLVVENKDKPGDEVLAEVLENGVWIAEEGKRVKVQRYVKDEDEDEDGDEDGDEGESEVEEKEEVEGDTDEEGVNTGENHGEYDAGEEVVDDDEAEEDAGADDADDEALNTTTVAAAEGVYANEELQLLAEQYTYYLDAQITANATATNDIYTTGAKHRASSVGGSSTSSSSTSEISDEGFSSSSSISTSATGTWKAGSGRGDDDNRAR